jgi:hypothetical protein
MNTSIDLANAVISDRSAAFDFKTEYNFRGKGLFSLGKVWAVLMVSLTQLSASTWVGGQAGEWSDVTRWSGGIPGENSDVLIQGSAKVVVGAAALADWLTIQKLDLLPDGGVSPQLQLSGLANRSFVALDTLTLDGDAVLEVYGSSLRIDGLLGGHLNFLAGQVSLREARIHTSGAATLRVGRTGSGRMTVLNSEVLAEADCIVGGLRGSSGVLELHSGVVMANGLFQIADDIGSEGLVRIHGGQLTATNVTARIGDDGRGSLEILGGLVRFGDVSVGRDITGEGQLKVLGGRLEAGDMSLGRVTGSQGIASFAGGEVLLPNDDLYVGRGGRGVLRLEGGTVHASNVVLAAEPGSSGVMEVHSGVLRTSRLNVASANATFRWEGGRIETGSTAADLRPFVVGNGRSPAVLSLLGGEHVFPGGLVISSNAVLEGKGTIVGRVTVLAGGSNRLEGTGPLPDAPRLALSLSGGVPSLSLTTVVGLGYVVEALGSGTTGWSAVGRVVGTGGWMTVVDSTGMQPFRIYRARVE